METESKTNRTDFNLVARVRDQLAHAGKESLLHSCAILMVRDALVRGAAYDKGVPLVDYTMSFCNSSEVAKAALAFMEEDLKLTAGHPTIYRLCTTDQCMTVPRPTLTPEKREHAREDLNDLLLVVNGIIARFKRPENQNIIDALRSGEFLTHPDTNRHAFTAAMSTLFEGRFPSIWLMYESKVTQVMRALEFYAGQLKEFHGQGIPGLQKARYRTVQEFRHIHRHILDTALDSYLRVAHS